MPGSPLTQVTINNATILPDQIANSINIFNADNISFSFDSNISNNEKLIKTNFASANVNLSSSVMINNINQACNNIINSETKQYIQVEKGWIVTFLNPIPFTWDIILKPCSSLTTFMNNTVYNIIATTEREIRGEVNLINLVKISGFLHYNFGNENSCSYNLIFSPNFKLYNTIDKNMLSLFMEQNQLNYDLPKIKFFLDSSSALLNSIEGTFLEDLPVELLAEVFSYINVGDIII